MSIGFSSKLPLNHAFVVDFDTEFSMPLQFTHVTRD
jgi:hypothetical protein